VLEQMIYAFRVSTETIADAIRHADRLAVAAGDYAPRRMTPGEAVLHLVGVPPGLIRS
jgi:hypothetical protein